MVWLCCFLWCKRRSLAQRQIRNLKVVIPKVAKAPVIDGKPNDPAWLNASIKGAKVVSDVDNTGSVLTLHPLSPI